MIELDRRRWLGHRWQQHGLGGPLGRAARADLLLLGVQDGRRGEAARALAVRGARAGRPVTAWTLRGAPHVHRLDAFDLVRGALAPQDGDEGGAEHAEAVAAVADALRSVVTGPTPKGGASAAVTAAVPGRHVAWCERCRAEHVPDGLFRSAALQAGLVLAPGRATVLQPAPDHPRHGAPEPRRALLEAFFRMNGPVARATVRDWAAWGTPSVAALWTGLVPVRVDGARLDLPEALAGAVTSAPPARGVVLVPPHDPYLRQVDRKLLVPDPARRRAVWRAVSGPGAQLVDGEVAGTWRVRGREDPVVTPFAAGGR